jgi:2-polyprenyl-3-methyl-5-hydroxy-6-metoxy-1,4-benzoquinol methylase
MTKRCDLCDHDQFVGLSSLDRKRKPLETEACTRCGLVSHRHIPTEAELASFYATDYRQAYHGEITPSARRVMRAWKHGERIYRQIGPFATPKSTVFEVGAGIGCTLKVFEQHGHRASGIEPNEGFEAYSRQQLGASVTKKYLFDLEPKPAFDLVLLVHVIEHFRSPRTALDHLHHLINPSGLLYVECPNLGAVTTREKLFHFAHIHNFTPATLEAMANRAGFVVARWFSHPHDPIIQVLLRRKEQTRWSVPERGLERTLEALNRYSYWSYHCRWEYLAPRSIELAGRAWEYVAAPPFVRSLLKSCQSSPAAIPSSNRRAA